MFKDVFARSCLICTAMVISMTRIPFHAILELAIVFLVMFYLVDKWDNPRIL